MRRKYSKTLCFLLALSLCVGLLPVSIMGANTTGFNCLEIAKLAKAGKHEKAH